MAALVVQPVPSHSTRAGATATIGTVWAATMSGSSAGADQPAAGDHDAADEAEHRAEDQADDARLERDQHVVGRNAR